MKTDHCAVCGETNDLHAHHFIPKSQGGGDEETNFLTLCWKCHCAIHEYQYPVNISRLTKAALQERKDCGQVLGSIPYGYRRDRHGKLKLDTREARVVTRIHALRHEGHSFLDIARILTGDHCPTKRGGRWSHVQISRIIRATGIDPLASPGDQDERASDQGIGEVTSTCTTSQIEPQTLEV